MFIELPRRLGQCRTGLAGSGVGSADFDRRRQRGKPPYANKLEEVGFRWGLATPVSFYHEEKDVTLVVHGDDFTFAGDNDSLWWVKELISKCYVVKVRARLGPGDRDDKQATLLGGIVRWEGRRTRNTESQC